VGLLVSDHVSLSRRLDQLIQATNAHGRGYDFEQLVGDLFRAMHFTVVANPGSATPRQVDLLATRGGETYLIETKWLHDPATIDDIDNLYTRLHAVPGSVVGILISYSGFTDHVLTRVKERSNMPVLLVSGSELQAALRWNGDLHILLRRKKKTLLSDREALLDEHAGSRPRNRTRTRTSLPQTRTEFVFPDSTRRTWLACGGGFGQFVFAQDLPDIDWSAGPGVGVAADLALPVRSEGQLLELIHQLADMGWATPDARWSIQQARTNWHGMGAGAFVEVLPAWKKRYNRRKSLHHSEELCYVDSCDGGFYTLTANVAAHDQRELHFARLSFQLIGTPLDTSPLRELCETFDVREQVYFRPRSSGSVTRVRVTHDLHLPVSPLALLVEGGDVDRDDGDDDANGREFVSGLVIPNPFRSKHTPWSGTHDLPNMVTDSEYLVCAMAEWHPLVYDPVTYVLTGIEHAWSSDGLVVRPVANWRPDASIVVTTHRPPKGPARVVG
jgi:hypothetical protein